MLCMCVWYTCQLGIVLKLAFGESRVVKEVDRSSSPSWKRLQRPLVFFSLNPNLNLHVLICMYMTEYTYPSLISNKLMQYSSRCKKFHSVLPGRTPLHFWSWMIVRFRFCYPCGKAGLDAMIIAPVRFGRSGIWLVPPNNELRGGTGPAH